MRDLWELSTAFMWHKMKNFFHFIDPFQGSETQIMAKETPTMLCQSDGPQLKQSTISTVSILLLNLLFSIYDTSESSTQKDQNRVLVLGIGKFSGNVGVILRNRNFGKQEKRHTRKNKLHLAGLYSQTEKWFFDLMYAGPLLKQTHICWMSI